MIKRLTVGGRDEVSGKEEPKEGTECGPSLEIEGKLNLFCLSREQYYVSRRPIACGSLCFLN